MRKALLLSVFILASCSSAPETAPCDGSGGGVVADAGPPCTHCADVAIAADANQDPIPLIAALCPASVPIWQTIPLQGCAGACAQACAGSLWCDALPKSIWVQPNGPCAACLSSLDGAGLDIEACFADR